MFVTGGGNNNTGFSHEGYDRLIREASDEGDVPTRMAKLAAAEGILVEEELPIWPVYYYVSLNMYPEHVTGIPGNILNLIDLKHIKVDRSARAAFLRGRGSPAPVVAAAGR
jgi:oligopeptide transport system substrate-binding protein